VTAVQALKELNVPHARIVITIEVSLSLSIPPILLRLFPLFTL
jgi:hypothetical protein